MANRLLMGIDIGTQGTKAIVIDEHGNLIVTGNCSYDFIVPQVGWTEQDPRQWWNAVIKSLQQIWNQGIQPEQIKGIGVSGQMHSLVLLDENKQELGNSILWNDVRTQEECIEIEQIIGKEKSKFITRNAILPGFTAPKIQWIKKNEPKRYNNICHVMLTKDYIVYKLSGIFSTDVSDASGTSLFDVEKREWSNEIIEALDIPFEWLPEVHESNTVVGGVVKRAANITGLLEGTPVIAGAGDNAAAALGNGIYEEGTGVISIGTSGTVFAPLKKLPPVKEEQALHTLHLFCHCLPNTWHAMGVTLSAGMSLNWFKSTFSQGTYDQILEDIHKIEAGSEGLIYLPYLNGERTPHNDPHARGVFFGMSYNHTRDHFTRAVIEGVSYSLKDCYELIKQCNVIIDTLYVTGGASKNIIWRQVLADVLGRKVKVFEEREGPAFGASLLAGLGVGLWNSPCDFPDFFKKGEETLVNHANVKRYQEGYEIYKDLYIKLKDTFSYEHASNR